MKDKVIEFAISKGLEFFVNGNHITLNIGTEPVMSASQLEADIIQFANENNLLFKYDFGSCKDVFGVAETLMILTIK